jgi:hypothetical protein
MLGNLNENIFSAGVSLTKFCRAKSNIFDLGLLL